MEIVTERIPHLQSDEGTLGVKIVYVVLPVLAMLRFIVIVQYK